MCNTPRSVVRPRRVRVRDVVRVRDRVRVVAALTSNNGTSRACGEAAMTGDGPRVVGNGAPGGSFRPAPGDRLD